MGRAAVTADSIPVDALASTPCLAEDGARILFVGVVRDHADGRPVRGMRYEAYEPMAREVLRAIVTEAETGFAVSRVEAVHRTGELAIGEASVAIVVDGPHRDAAYAASRYVIEEIKKRLPVWKHEHFTDGEARWVKGTPLAPPAAAGGTAATPGEGGAHG